MPALFFSVVVISVDAESKTLKVLCIGLHTRREEFFHQIVGLYYLKKLPCQIIVKRLILVGQKRPRARCYYGKVMHYTIPWVAPLNVQDVNVFLAHVCEYIEIFSKSSMLSTSNMSSDVRGAEQ